MDRARVNDVGDFEIDLKYVERLRSSTPDATFVIANDTLAECSLNQGTGKYGPIISTGENAGWHFSRPQQFRPGLNTDDGAKMVLKACGEAAEAALTLPGYDHYSFTSPRELPRTIHRYTSQQVETLARSTYPQATDLGIPVTSYDIEVNGNVFFKTQGIDLASVPVICVFTPMLEMKGINALVKVDGKLTTRRIQ